MIHIHELSFGYKKQDKLFDSLSLQVPTGNIYGLLGRNGAGKSSLLKLLTGLLYPHQGQMEVMGFDPSFRSPEFLQDFYFVPEDLYVPNLKIGAFQRMYAPFYPKFDAAQFEGYLAEFGLDASMKLTHLSYGQKKKVLLGFGLATNSSLLILDEPTNGLDIPSKSQFRKLLASSITEDRTVIISTHQVRDMGNLIDPIIILDEGKVIFQQSIEEITQRLAFDIQYQMADPKDAIYSERVPGGHMTVKENEHGMATDIDLEILFNAVTMQTDAINAIFRKEVSYEA